jgi:hypothetical protein
MGKSALLATWAAQQRAIRHFIREGDAQTYDVLRIFENLGRQLSEQYNVAWESPRTPDPVDYRRAFETTLDRAAQAASSPIVLVIDGLDEAVRAGNADQDRGARQTIVDWLPEPTMLPDGVRLILSTRPELLEHAAFAAKFDRDKADRLEPGRLTDIEVRAILYQIWSKYEVLAAPDYVDAIVQRSEGSPLYLRMLVEDLIEGRMTFGEIATLPQGVTDYFKRVLTFIEQEGWSREQPDSAVLLQAKRESYAMLVSIGKLTQPEMDDLLAREQAALEGRAGLNSLDLLLLYCLAREPLTIREASSMLEADPRDTQRAFEVIRTVLVDAGTAHFDLFHSGFRQYVLQLDRYTDTRLQRYAANITQVQQRLLAYCGRWPEHTSPYALRHYPAHLYDAAQHTQIYTLARDAVFQQVQRRAFPAEPDLPLLTVQTALRSAADTDQAAPMAEFLLRHARQVSELQQESPLDALRSGNLKRALKLADLTDPERRVLWYLLLAWELYDGGWGEAAAEVLDMLCSGELPRLDHRKHRNADIGVVLLARLIMLHPERSADLALHLLPDYNRSELGKRLAAEGHMAIALRIANSLISDGYREEVLLSIVEAQIQAGQFVDACQSAATIINEYVRAKMLRTVAVAQCQAGQFVDALNTAVLIADWGEQAKALQAIAITQAQAGYFSDAYQTATKIRVEVQQAKTLDTIAGYQAQSKQRNSLDVIGDIPEVLGNIANVHTQGKERNDTHKNFTEAFHTAIALKNAVDRAEALRAIAIAQAQVGYFSDAHQTVATIEMESERATALANIAVVQAQARLSDDAHQTFTAAIQIAAAIADEWPRVWTLRDIADLQIGVGYVANARQTLFIALQTTALSTDNRWCESALPTIAQVQAHIGQFTNALQTVTAVATEDRALVVQEIAKTYIQAGHVIDIRRILVAITDQETQTPLLSAIGKTQAQVGHFTDALKTAAKILDKEAQTEVLQAIAEIQAQAGYFTDALKTTTMIVNVGDQAVILRTIAETQKQAGQVVDARRTFANARRTAARITDGWKQTWVLRTIATAQAQAGYFTDALKTVVALTDKFDKALTLAGIAEAQAHANQSADAHQTFASALKTATALEHEWQRARVLRDIAISQVQAGQKDAARQSFVAATQSAIAAAAIADEGEEYLAQELQDIATAQAQTGQFADAFTTTAIMHPWQRVVALQAIAAAQAQSGYFADALQTTTTIERKQAQIQALTSIAIAQIQVGQEEDADRTFATAIQITATVKGERKQTEALQGILNAQIQAERFMYALQTVAAIEREPEQAEVLRRIATAQARAGFGSDALQTAETIRTDREKHLPAIAEALLDAGDHAHFKQLFRPCAAYLESAYTMCGLLARAYSDQVNAIARVVLSNATDSSPANDDQPTDAHMKTSAEVEQSASDAVQTTDHQPGTSRNIVTRMFGWWRKDKA